jgi:hypothetical protein
MAIKDLLDEDAFEPEKLFDKEKYNTVVLDREGNSKRENKAADLLEALLDRDISREESEEIFSALKETNARELMMDAIGQAKYEREKALLISACWESGLDFTPHFLFFAALATAKEYTVALEALTVLQECGAVEEKVLEEAFAIAGAAPGGGSSLLPEVIAHLESRRSAS